jgi:uncharacterized NAD(P)/FAD-binding protein YdhS
LCANAREVGEPVVVDVVDPAPAGPGAVWRPDQSPELLMNTVTSQVSLFTDESVRCDGPLVRGPSLYEWACRLRAGEISGDHPEVCLAEAARLGPDDYPTRAFYGHYLEWVVDWLVSTAPENVTVRMHRGEAVALDDSANGRTQEVTLADGTRLTGFDRVVLALDHGPLVPSGTEREHREFATRHGLHYVSPANPADADLDVLEPGMPVLVRGLGLCFFDYLALLTVGRGGRFTDDAKGLVYEPSGREPLLRHLHATGQAQPYRIGRYESGGLAVTPRPYRVVDRVDRALGHRGRHPARGRFGHARGLRRDRACAAGRGGRG